jgi:hypothetical protein
MGILAGSKERLKKYANKRTTEKRFQQPVASSSSR